MTHSKKNDQILQVIFLKYVIKINNVVATFSKISIHVEAQIIVGIFHRVLNIKKISTKMCEDPILHLIGLATSTKKFMLPKGLRFNFNT